MKLSTLSEITSQNDLTDAFGGYNHNLRIPDNEFYDMQNMTSSNYPILSPRSQRGVYQYADLGIHKPNGIIAKDALCYVDGETLYINNNPVAGLMLTNSPKQLISMGAYIIIMPDRKYINTMDYSDKGDIDATFISASTVSYELCRVDGTEYRNATVSSVPPSEPENMALWIDTSSTPHILKQYSSTSGMWVEIATTYIKIKCVGIAGMFKQYDGVKISGLDTTNIPGLKDLEGQTSLLWDVHHNPEDPSEDYIVVVGFLDNIASQSGEITVSRRMPRLDFIIESENRLWGCRYGLSNDGEVVNEIYASKLGDFKNWNSFMGTSADSYVASCGTDGQWTGAVTHLGYPLFFKENCLHKVYGNFPSNYQVQTTACRGVMKGAGRSLSIVNEILYYKSRNGVCAYDGSLPQEISGAFGEIHYTGVDETNPDTLRNGAVAGTLGNKYYISMISEVDGEHYLFAYDTSKGMWHKEDNTAVDAFCSCNGDLYYIDHKDLMIRSILGIREPKETAPIKWMAETGVLGTSIPSGRYSTSVQYKKYIGRILLRMSLEVGAKMMIYAQYDSCGEWEHLTSITGTTLRTFSIPVKPKRCDHLRLRFVGEGDAKIYSISKKIERGSDL